MFCEADRDLGLWTENHMSSSWTPSEDNGPNERGVSQTTLRHKGKKVCEVTVTLTFIGSSSVF